LQVTDVKALNASTVDATVLIRFHKIPQPSVTVKGPDGPQLVRASDDAYMRLPFDRDKK
jgi:hypothetical protein